MNTQSAIENKIRYAVANKTANGNYYIVVIVPASEKQDFGTYTVGILKTKKQAEIAVKNYNECLRKNGLLHHYGNY